MIEIERQPIASPAELAARFVSVRARPWGDASLGYEMLIPRELRPVANLAARAVGPLEGLQIGAFRGARAPDGIEVSVMRPGCEVSLVDLFDRLRDAEGLEVVELGPLVRGDREAVDALARRELPGANGAPGRPEILRFVLFRNGPYVVRISARLAESRYDALAEPFAVSLATFRFREPAGGAFLEPFVWTASRGAIPLGFRRPACWAARERDDVPWGHEVIVLTRTGEGADALIRVHAIDRDVAQGMNLEVLARDSVEALRRSGLEARAVARRWHPRPPSSEFEKETLAVGLDGRAFGGDAEGRVTLLRSGRALYAIGAILPARARDTVGWMATKRALEVVVLSLNQPEDAALRMPGSDPVVAEAPPEEEPSEEPTEETAGRKGREEE